MIRYFLTDIDNACLDYSTAFVSYLQKNYPELELNLDEYSFGVEEKVIEGICHEFTLTKEFGELPPLRDAQEYIPKLAELGFKFQGITSCLPDSTLKTYTRIHKLRIDNLTKHFGNAFIGCTLICMHESKKKYLESFDPTYWIDDKPKHVVSAVASGHTSFLMSWSYNKKKKIGKGIRVSTWKEVYEKVIKDEEI